jgi:RNA-splicing ligase RtcB
MSNVKIYAAVIEDEAKEQVELLSQQKSFCDQKIRIMPDVHAGKGCVIGFTSTIGDYVIPNVVGVDIGCGMLTIELGQCDIDLHNLDDIIRHYVPSGRNVHEGRVCKFDKLQTLRCYRELKDTKRLERSIGTLGGGNHFIEIDIDDDENKYLVIHTGSRNLGKQVAEYYQNLAYELLCGKDKLLQEQDQLIADYKAQGRRNEIQQAVKELKKKYKAQDCDIPKDLAYLTGKHKEDYLHDMAVCQEYAVLNRRHIARIIIENLGLNPDLKSFETIHNYIDLDSNIIRKGAINADRGKRLLIPLNMRDGCIIGVGKGNKDWNNSAPHGAGRIMSRMKAKAQFTMEEYENSMQGIFTTSVCKDTLDELPMAYKDMADIISVIGDTIDIVNIIKPIYNFKASE